MNSKLTWWFKIVHGIAGIWWRRRLCMEKKKWVHEGKKGKTRERSKLYDKICHFSGGKDLCLSAPPGEAGWEAGWAAIAFHWQADKQGGAAWRQKGHYQRLGQTEIRASFGPGRQANARTQASERMHAHTHRDPGKTSPWKDWKTVKPCALWKCHLWKV